MQPNTLRIDRRRAVARGKLGPDPSTPPAGSRPATAAAGERPCQLSLHRTQSGGRPSPTEALRCLHACSSSAQTKDCKRCKRNSSLGPWSKRMDLTPASTDPCPHGRNARPETPLFSCTFSCRQEKRVLDIAESPCSDCDRGDRIRTCDLVLPKQVIGSGLVRVSSHSNGFGRCCPGLSGLFWLVLSGI
jgi:hypothetical protein